MDKETNKRSIKERIKGLSITINNELIVDKLNKVEWIALALILCIIFFTLFYGDNLGMFLTYFWVNQGLLKNGSVRFLGNNQMAYGVVQQLFGSVWTFPVNIIYTIRPFEIANTATVLWFKLSMVFIMGLTIREIIKIADTLKISKERTKWMIIMLLSTVLVALPVFHIAQSDMLYTYLTVLGIHAFLKNDKKKFILFFAMAISCKVIAVFVFIPLLLMMEKRILHIMLNGILGVIILPLERIWYKLVDLLNTAIVGFKHNDIVKVEKVVDGATIVVEKTQEQVSMDFFSHFYHKMLYFEFPAIRKGYVASLLVFLFVLLCIFCYAQKKEDLKVWNETVIFVSTVALLIFFVNASPSPYWIVVLYPPMMLMIFLKPERIRFNMILQSAFTYLMFLVYVVNTHWVYGGPSNLDYLLLKGLIKPGHTSDMDEGPYVARYLKNLGIESVMNVITAACLAAAVGLVVVNYRKVKIDEELTAEEEKKLMHGFVIFQIAFLWIWYAFSLYAVTRW